jgi:hypothetical protein
VCTFRDDSTSSEEVVINEFAIKLYFMTNPDLFVPFFRTEDGDSIELLSGAYTELLSLQQAEFETVVVSEKFIFHLDTFLRFSWYVPCGWYLLGGPPTLLFQLISVSCFRH